MDASWVALIESEKSFPLAEGPKVSANLMALASAPGPTTKSYSSCPWLP